MTDYVAPVIEAAVENDGGMENQALETVAEDAVWPDITEMQQAEETAAAGVRLEKFKNRPSGAVDMKILQCQRKLLKKLKRQKQLNQ